MSTTDQKLLALLLIPPVGALFGFVITSWTGMFFGLPALILGVLLAILALRSDLQDPRLESSDSGVPWLLLLFVGLYFLLKFDLSHYHLLGVNGPASQALGIGLGASASDPTSNQVLALIPRVPEGQIVLATAAQSLAGALGARILFAWVFVCLSIVGWRLSSWLFPSRPRIALVVGSFCSLNPAFMECVSLDSLGNALPALGLGVVLLLTALRSYGVALGLITGIAVLTRPTMAIGLLPLLLLLCLRAEQSLRTASRLTLGISIPFALMLSWSISSGLPLFFDPGLTPLNHEAMKMSATGWWWSLGSRAPWSDGPMWSVASTGLLARVGTVAFVVIVLGAFRFRLLRELALPVLTATVAPLFFFLLRGPAFSGEQHDRLFVFVIPIALLLALGLDAIASRWSNAKLKTLVLLLLGSTFLVAAGNGLREASFPINAAAYQSFPRLLPQKPDASKPQASGPLWWLPGYTPRHLLDPLFDQAGQRWRDLGWHVLNPRINQRPMSIDERALERIKGPEFREQWLPNHPLGRLPVPQPEGDDPYGERTPLLLLLDLSDALTKGQIRLSPASGETPDFDLAKQEGPLRLNDLQLADQGQLVNVTLWKEYRSSRDAETAIVIMPRWGEKADPIEHPVTRERVLIQVPSNGFASIVLILGERTDTTALIAGLEWNIRLQPQGGLEVFGPFRL